MMRRRAGQFCMGLVVAGVLVMLAQMSSVRAEPLAVVGGEPVGIKAERMELDLHKGVVVLTGDVRVERGDWVVTCDRVEARYDKAPNVTWALASGSVHARGKGYEATVVEAELLVQDRVIKLRGGLRMSRAGAWMEAREATIDLTTNKVSLGQVRGAVPISSGTILPQRASGGRAPSL